MLATAGVDGGAAYAWNAHLTATNESTCSLNVVDDEQLCPRCTPTDACLHLFSRGEVVLRNLSWPRIVSPKEAMLVQWAWGDNRWWTR